jgi:hypothetical protein
MSLHALLLIGHFALLLIGHFKKYPVSDWIHEIQMVYLEFDSAFFWPGRDSSWTGIHSLITR